MFNIAPSRTPLLRLHHSGGPLVLCYLIYLHLILVLHEIYYPFYVHRHYVESLTTPILMAMMVLLRIWLV